MSRRLLVSLLLAASLASGAVLADEPSLHQVYQTAEAGHLDQARTMMDEVLKNHPNSGKAHYVEAELLAKQGLARQAATELATAERLAPGLPFAKPEAVRELRQLVGQTGATAAPRSVAPAASLAPAAGGFPWGMVLVGVGVLAFIVIVARRMAPQQAAPAAYSGYGGYGAGNAGMSTPTPPAPYGGQPGGVPPAGTGPGLGSRVMGGLATGAALGAGMVAGEALASHFLDRHDDPTPRKAISDPGPLDLGTPTLGNDDDLGGTDFGVSDGGSWDDGGGSSDWN